MLELKDECILNKIPMYAVVGEETGQGTQYASVIATPAFLNTQLSDDRISPLNPLLSKRFRIEYMDEVEPGDVQAQIDELFAGDDNEK